VLKKMRKMEKPKALIYNNRIKNAGAFSYLREGEGELNNHKREVVQKK